MARAERHPRKTSVTNPSTPALSRQPRVIGPAAARTPSATLRFHKQRSTPRHGKVSSARKTAVALSTTTAAAAAAVAETVAVAAVGAPSRTPNHQPPSLLATTSAATEKSAGLLTPASVGSAEVRDKNNGAAAPTPTPPALPAKAGSVVVESSAMEAAPVATVKASLSPTATSVIPAAAVAAGEGCGNAEVQRSPRRDGDRARADSEGGQREEESSEADGFGGGGDRRDRAVHAVSSIPRRSSCAGLYGRNQAAAFAFASAAGATPRVATVPEDSRGSSEDADSRSENNTDDALKGAPAPGGGVPTAAAASPRPVVTPTRSSQANSAIPSGGKASPPSRLRRSSFAQGPAAASPRCGGGASPTGLARPGHRSRLSPPATAIQGSSRRRSIGVMRFQTTVEARPRGVASPKMSDGVASAVGGERGSVDDNPLRCGSPFPLASSPERAWNEQDRSGGGERGGRGGDATSVGGGERTGEKATLSLLKRGFCSDDPSAASVPAATATSTSTSLFTSTPAAAAAVAAAEGCSPVFPPPNIALEEESVSGDEDPAAADDPATVILPDADGAECPAKPVETAHATAAPEEAARDETSTGSGPLAEQAPASPLPLPPPPPPEKKQSGNINSPEGFQFRRSLGSGFVEGRRRRRPLVGIGVGVGTHTVSDAVGAFSPTRAGRAKVESDDRGAAGLGGASRGDGVFSSDEDGSSSGEEESGSDEDEEGDGDDEEEGSSDEEADERRKGGWGETSLLDRWVGCVNVLVCVSGVCWRACFLFCFVFLVWFVNDKLES